MPDILRFRGFPRNALEFPVPTDYISGCYLSFVTGGTQIQIGPGTCWSNVYGGCITVTTAFNITPTLAASSVYYVYLTGETSAYASTIAPTNYQGTAWQSRSGERYIGSILSTSGNLVTNFLREGNHVRYRANVEAAPFNVLSGGTATTATSVGCSTVIPATSFMASIIVFPTSSLTAGSVFFGSSTGFTPTTTAGETAVNAQTSTIAVKANLTISLDTSQAFLYCNNASTTTAVVDVNGYFEDR